MTKAERQILAVGLANLKLNAINNAKLESIQGMLRKYLYEGKNREEIKNLDREIQACMEKAAQDLPLVFEITLHDDFDLSKLKFS